MRDIQTIITPIDFSENAESIIESAAYIAGKLNAHLHLIFVIQNFEDYSGIFVPPVNLPNLEEQLLESAQKKMNELVENKKDFITNSGVKELESAVLTGDVTDEILGYTREKRGDLIVMGTHGYKGIERVMFGSIADKVVKTACCPVLTINPYRKNCEEELK